MLLTVRCTYERDELLISASSLTWGSYFGYLIWFSNDDSLLSDEELPYIGDPWTCRAIYLFTFSDKQTRDYFKIIKRQGERVHKI